MSAAVQKRVVLIGHCGPDSSYLRMTVAKAIPDARILSADDEGRLQEVLAEGAELVMVNRVLDYGFAEDAGVDLIRRLHTAHPGLRLMLVSNYTDSQSEAVAAGALPGFGKREMGTPSVVELIQNAVA